MPRSGQVARRAVTGVVVLALVVGVLSLRACLHVDPRAALTEIASAPYDPPHTRAYVGTLHLDRPGAIIVGVDSPSVARLDVGGAAIVGDGLRKGRVIVPGRELPFRVALPADARLVWEPVGRRGVSEYVSAHDLNPSIAHTDGVFALALLLIVVGAAVFALRHRIRACPRPVMLATLGVLALALVTRLLGLGAQGQTWDEAVNWTAGKNYVSNLLGLDFSDHAWAGNLEHPPLTKLLAGVAAHLGDDFQLARGFSALCVALACALLVPIGARLFRLRVGMLAGVVAALIPALVAHGQVVGHEALSLFLWMVAMVLALAVHDRTPTRPQLASRLGGVGVAVGLAASSRFIAGLVLIPCALAMVVTAPAALRRATLVRLPLVAVAAFLTFWAVWPRLWVRPVAALRESLGTLATTHSPEWFLGDWTATPGGHYFVVYLLATVPAVLLVAAVIGGVRAVRDGEADRDAAGLILLAWLVIPLLVAVSPVRQDGVRYVLPSVLALALFAAVGIDWLARSRRAFVVVTLAVSAYLAIALLRIAPYPLDYYNELAGGPAGVQQRRAFETAWWGEGLDRAVAYVNEHAKPGERVWAGCILPAHLAWFDAEARGELATSQDEATWLVHYAGGYDCGIASGLALEYAVTAQGATLARVFKRR